MISAATTDASQQRYGSTLKLHREETFGEVSSRLHDLPKCGKPRLQENGPRVAVNTLPLGVAAHSASGRGGARNSARRVSHALTGRQLVNLSAATRHAGRIGLPFTRMITIHWQAAGIPLHRMAWATGRFMDLLSKALARHRSSTAWVWVHENGPGKGGHCHLLAHVPAALVPLVAGSQKRWLRRITDSPYRARVILSKPIGGRLGLELSNRALHAANVDAALTYIVKGTDPETAAQFALDRVDAGGVIIGKRCGTSQNIGATARREMEAKHGNG